MAYLNSQGQLVDDPSQQAGFVNPNLGLYATGIDDGSGQSYATPTPKPVTAPPPAPTPISKYAGTTSQPAQQVPGQPQSGVPSTLQLLMPDGSTKTIPITAADLQGHAGPDLQSAIAGGGQVINPSTGQPLAKGANAYGGSLFKDASGNYVPLQVALGYNYFPGQEQAYNALSGANTPANMGTAGFNLNQPRLDPAMGSDPGSQYLVPGYKDPGTPTGPTYAGPTSSTSNTGGNLNSLLQGGVSGGPNYISDVNLPTTPQISSSFDPAFMGQYESDAASYVNNLGGYYGGNWGKMDPAQMNTGAIPQVLATGYNAQTPGSFGALNFLLSGQGFDPATLARMNTTASDAISREQAGQLSSSRIAAQNAGMADSGASLANQSVINRQAGDARTQAANQIAIQNAMQGINNLTTGAGMELGRETTAAGMQNQAGQFNAQMANQAALQNAMNEFQAMTQNVNNQQQANATNTQNTFAQNQARAQAQSGAANQIIQNTMAGQLSRNANADFTNTQNLIGQQLNQAQLNRQRQMFNAGMGENRYSQALGTMAGLAGSANPYAYYGSSASAGGNYNPNLTIPNAVSGISTSLNANPYSQKTTT